VNLKITLFFPLLICFTLVFYGQEAIPWAGEHKLTWTDFQAKAPKHHEASAMSDITFTIDLKSDGDMLKVFIAPSFNPDGSWVKEGDRTDYLLGHEQIHFDIYEVNARKLRKELATKKLTSVNTESTINHLMEKYNTLNSTVQERYDSETNHSINVKKQEKWIQDISTELEELKDFSSPEFDVPIEMK
jgi:hypothetical protein